MKYGPIVLSADSEAVRSGIEIIFARRDRHLSLLILLYKSSITIKGGPATPMCCRHGLKFDAVAGECVQAVLTACINEDCPDDHELGTSSALCTMTKAINITS